MNFENFIDISLPIKEGSVVWPGATPVKFSFWHQIEKGDMTNDSDVEFNVHVGTHIDAPAHFLKDGATVDKLDLHKFIGDVFVVEIPGTKEITADILESKLHSKKRLKRLLLKTDNSDLLLRNHKEFNKDFCALSIDAAQWVVDHGLVLVGNDYLSVQRFDGSPEVHTILLSAEVVILEGVDLRAVSQGDYKLVCLPMNFVGLEGAPVRALLYPKN
ncbi:MAG: cyclase family protein [Candidatus Omnitrophica bacterium]|nr:cyclase family protein [Candidatus Omnitrophota bacterium]